jgi:hypothetical protein
VRGLIGATIAPVAANAVARLCGAMVLGALTLVTRAPVVLPGVNGDLGRGGFLVLFGSIFLSC